MEDQVCPRCRTTKYRNPSLRLLVNVCGHSLCESCVDLLFLKGSGSCPECQAHLRKCNFRVQLFEDPEVEKEVDIRKRVLRDYNKKEEDFRSLEEYNNYLEDVENIIYNLTNNIDTLETQKKIDQYKKENKDIIQKNKMKIGRGELELEELIEIEKQISHARKLDVFREEVENKKMKLRSKEALIDELTFSHSDAKDIVKLFSREIETEMKENAPEKLSKFSTGIKFTNGSYLPIAKIEEGPLFSYEEPSFVSDGPMPPKWEDLNGNYLQHVREPTNDERAGGFDSNISCMRALQEAVVGLYFKNT